MKEFAVFVFVVVLAWLARTEGYRAGFDDGLDASPAIVAEEIARSRRDEEMWLGMACDRSDREMMCDKIIEVVQGGMIQEGMFDDLIPRD